jgi:Trk K+ transport system NAD-binding subunit
MLSSVGSVRAPSEQAVLVCGLGRLGQQCVKALAGYRVPVHAIDLQPPALFATELVEFTLGDFRDVETLRLAGVAQCRSIVLLASDTAANIEGAFAARRINPDIRVVIRGEQQAWQDVLADRLGNLVVYEPNRLAAPAFAFAVLDAHMLAHFYVDDQLFQVTEHSVQTGERWVGEPIEAAQAPGRQILLHIPESSRLVPVRDPEFYDWPPDQRIAVGDRLLILTRTQPVAREAGRTRVSWRENLRVLWRDFQRQRREGLSRAAQVGLTGVAVMATLLVLAVLYFVGGAWDLKFFEALRVAMMLMSGGHLADVSADFERLPSGVLWSEVLLSFMGTLLTAIVYALLTDRLLTARFNLLARRPRPPVSGHVIIAGLGATGERVAALLEQLERPALGIEDAALGQHTPERLPVIRGSATQTSSLQEAHLDSAHGLVAVTSDELQNVQIALKVASLNPRCRLAVRIFDPRLADNVSSVLPDARILCITQLAATAYAAAALGEHVLNLFQMLGKPVLVVEYLINEGDTLNGRALWEIGEGYGVVPVLFEPAGGKARVPTLDDSVITLEVGDRLVVLASAASLEAIERGDLRPREYELTLEGLRPYAEPMQVVGLLVQRFGYKLEEAHAVLRTLPQLAPQRMYGLYARRTYRLLRTHGVMASLRRVSAQDPLGSVEALGRRAQREPTLDLRRSLGTAGQARERALSSAPPQPRLDRQN